MIGRRIFAVDLRSLAVMRVGLALLLLADLIGRASDLEAHYSDLGVLPRALLAHFPVVQGSLSLHALHGSTGFQALLFVAAAASAVALGVGYRTRIATIASWALLVSLHNRNPMVLTGGDDLLRLLLFWGCFLPLGARASLDARRSGARRANMEPDRHVSLAGAALLLQIALVYPIAAIFKWREPAWTSLEAIARTLSVEGVATELGRLLLLRPECLPFLTAAVLAFETLAAVIPFVPDRRGIARMLGVALFVGFHLVALGTTMNIGLFPLVAATGWLAFLPPTFWRLLPFRGRSPARATPDPEVEAPSVRSGRDVAQLFAVGTAGLCILFYDAATLGWLPGERLVPPGIVRNLTHALRLDQRWSLWTTPPENRYYVFAAGLADGSTVDLHRDGAGLDWTRPRRRCASNRWWKYKLSLSQPAFAPLRPALARRLERTAQTESDLGSSIDSLELWMLLGPANAVAAGNARRERLWPVPARRVDPRGRDGPRQP